MTDELRKTIEELGVDGAEEKAQKLLAYMDAVLEKNESVNLTAITDREEFVNKHLIDSLACCRLDAFRSARTIADIGTGGGFPGVPLAVAFPQKSFTLVDSLNKRVRIVEEICESLGITNVETVHGRAEDLARRREMRDGFDLCVSRAVANLNTLSELCMPFVKVGGSFLAYKGSGCSEEVDSAAKAIELLGGDTPEIIAQPTAAGMENHNLVLIRKIVPTDERFPRKAGKPSREPLR